MSNYEQHRALLITRIYENIEVLVNEIAAIKEELEDKEAELRHRNEHRNWLENDVEKFNEWAKNS